LIHEKGFNGVSVDQVAAAVQMRKANLFHYYPSKELLGLAVFDYAARHYRKAVAEHFGSDSVDPIEAVNRTFNETIERMKLNNCSGGCFIGNLAQEMSDQNEKFRQKLSEFFSYWTMQVAGLLDRARATGYFRPELNPMRAAEAIVSLYEGALLCCKAKRQVSCLESAREMAEAYLRGYKTATEEVR